MGRCSGRGRFPVPTSGSLRGTAGASAWRMGLWSFSYWELPSKCRWNCVYQMSVSRPILMLSYCMLSGIPLLECIFRELGSLAALITADSAVLMTMRGPSQALLKEWLHCTSHHSPSSRSEIRRSMKVALPPGRMVSVRRDAWRDMRRQ